jgi:hypothetical protein
MQEAAERPPCRGDVYRACPFGAAARPFGADTTYSSHCAQANIGGHVSNLTSALPTSVVHAFGRRSLHARRHGPRGEPNRTCIDRQCSSAIRRCLPCEYCVQTRDERREKRERKRVAIAVAVARARHRRKNLRRMQSESEGHAKGSAARRIGGARVQLAAPCIRRGRATARGRCRSGSRLHSRACSSTNARRSLRTQTCRC